MLLCACFLVVWWLAVARALPAPSPIAFSPTPSPSPIRGDDWVVWFYDDEQRASQRPRPYVPEDLTFMDAVDDWTPRMKREYLRERFANGENVVWGA